jgi:peptidoglycan/xylan/chitin deacetylase (PgdA/CDA1 family)
MSSRTPIVLAYHGVDVRFPAEAAPLFNTPQQLEAHVKLLKRLGYRFVTATDLTRGDRGGRVAALTFDDGWENWRRVVLPLLDRLGVPASFYVCPGWFGGHHPDVRGPAGELLDEDEVRALVDAGMEVGSHSNTHPDLTALDDDRLEQELVGSKQRLETLTGVACETLAYPFGAHDARVVDGARAAGYRLAFGWRRGPWSALAAPRLVAPPGRGAPSLAAKLLGIRRPRR